MVPDSADVVEVATGPHGPVRRVREPASSSPTCPRSLRRSRVTWPRSAAALGASWLDAPVSGGEAGAMAGTLTIMVGGEAAAFAARAAGVRSDGQARDAHRAVRPWPDDQALQSDSRRRQSARRLRGAGVRRARRSRSRQGARSAVGWRRGELVVSDPRPQDAQPRLRARVQGRPCSRRTFGSSAKPHAK